MRKRLREYAKKSALLADEVLRELSIGCFLKAISGFWFSAEALLRCIVWLCTGKMYESASKLIQVLGRKIVKRYFPQLN